MLESRIVLSLSDPNALESREAWFRQLESLFDGRRHEPIRLWGNAFFPPPPADPYHDVDAWIDEALSMMSHFIDQYEDREVFRPQALEFGLYGVHFIDRIFGAEVFFQDGQWYNHPLSQEVGLLQPPDLDGDATWALARKAAESFLRKGTLLPLFGLPTIASSLNVAVNLFGQEILIALLMDPEAAVHDLKVINEVLTTIHRWYIDRIPEAQLQPVVSWQRTQPRGQGQICGCSTQLISPEVYAEYLAPLDDELLSVYPKGGMIHLCGSHVQHIPTWRAMKSLRAVQINDRAAQDLKEYHRGLRDDQILYVNTFPGMTAEKAISITDGRRLVLVEDPAMPAIEDKEVCGCGCKV